MGEPLLKIVSMREALRYGDEWQQRCWSMEAALALATAQRDASDLLLSIASDELLRLKQLCNAQGESNESAGNDR